MPSSAFIGASFWSVTVMVIALAPVFAPEGSYTVTSIAYWLLVAVSKSSPLATEIRPVAASIANRAASVPPRTWLRMSPESTSEPLTVPMTVPTAAFSATVNPVGVPAGNCGVALSVSARTAATG